MKDILGAIQCFFRGVFLSIKHNAPISGHVIQEKEVHEKCKVIIGECETCKKFDISWEKFS